jgi:Leucine-rich repeat (LRR) protein
MINISHTLLNELPTMRHLTAKILNASNNNIRNLWEEDLPRDLEELDLNTNIIHSDGLLVEWPTTIVTLNLSYNPLYSLEHVNSWPTRLISLNLSNTNLRGVFQGSYLPETLQSLNVSNTAITRIHKFPRALKEFIALRTELKILPEVCNHVIEKIVVSNSLLGNWGLPYYWGTALKYLDLNSNYLRTTPENLPEGLEFMNLSGNQIQFIREFPNTLKMLHLNCNRILEIPPWVLKFTALKFTIRDNCLLKPSMTLNCITDSCQWIGARYNVSANIIQRAWRKITLNQFLRTIWRVLRIREELLTVAMHPKRASQFQDISSEWL